MRDHKNVIELNGKLYDSVSGKIIGSAGHDPSKPVVIKPKSNGTAVDGFVKKPAAKKISVSSTSHKPVHKPNKSRASGRDVVAHNRQQTKTLIRKGLKKPATHEATHSEVKAEKTTHHSSRWARAKSTPQSPKISRFGHNTAGTTAFTKKTAHIHVKPSPRQAHGDTEQVIQQVEAPIPNHNQILKEQLVAKAIKDARVEKTTHKKARKHRVANKLGISPKIIHFGMGTFAAILLIGFIGYQNATNMSMKVASSRAGFNASVPGYQPAGFGMSGPIEYGPGQVTLNFRSHSDNRNFHITQKTSNWNSEALLNNFVVSNNKSYQTYQEKGQTIYIYDGSNATWVHGGVWYQVEGDSSLSSDQLLKIASSI